MSLRSFFRKAAKKIATFVEHVAERVLDVISHVSPKVAEIIEDIGDRITDVVTGVKELVVDKVGEKALILEPAVLDTPEGQDFASDYIANLVTGYDPPTPIATRMFESLSRAELQTVEGIFLSTNISVLSVEEVLVRDKALAHNRSLPEMLEFYATQLEAGYRPQEETAAAISAALAALPTTDPHVQDLLADIILNLTPLPETLGVRFDGVMGGDRAGESLVAVGDINGDGVDDIVIGARFAGIDQEGAAYVVFGGQAFEPSVALASVGLPGGPAGFVVNGIAGGDALGTAVEIVDDIDGDGIDDLLISAPAGDVGGTDSGETYVIFGGQDFSAGVDLATLGQAGGIEGFAITGLQAYDWQGINLANAGDINSDGINDFLIGAHGGGPSSFAGETYLIYGGQDFGAGVDLSTLGQVGGAAGGRFAGTSNHGFAGYRVAGTGDIDGDGIDDFMISANANDPNSVPNAGETWVIYGGQSFEPAPGDPWISLASVGVPGGIGGFRVVGAAYEDRVGIDIAAGGDINGDGINDLLIGSLQQFKPGNGQLHVIYGGQDFDAFGGEVPVSTIGQAGGADGFTLTGEELLDVFAVSLASVGDVNGDGTDDILIGAFFADPNGEVSAGASYLVFGGQDFDSLAPAGEDIDIGTLGQPGQLDGFVFNGAAAGDLSGLSVSGAGDINDDGIDDLVIGAYAAGPSGAGAAYLVHGGTDILERFDASDGVLDARIDLANLMLHPADFDTLV